MLAGVKHNAGRFRVRYGRRIDGRRWSARCVKDRQRERNKWGSWDSPTATKSSADRGYGLELRRGIYRDGGRDMLQKERASSKEIMDGALGFYRGSGEGQTELRRGVNGCSKSSSFLEL